GAGPQPGGQGMATARPRVTRSPGRIAVGPVIRRPLTKVPLVEPRSSTTSPPAGAGSRRGRGGTPAPAATAPHSRRRPPEQGRGGRRGQERGGGWGSRVIGGSPTLSCSTPCRRPGSFGPRRGRLGQAPDDHVTVLVRRTGRDEAVVGRDRQGLRREIPRAEPG